MWLAKLLGFHLQEWKLLNKATKVSMFRNRIKIYCNFSQSDPRVCASNDVNGLILKLDIHNTEKQCLFVFAPKMSVNTVLLHNGNKFLSIPVAHAVPIKESYENVCHTLEALKYENHHWHIYLRVIGCYLACRVNSQIIPVFCAYGRTVIQNHTTQLHNSQQPRECSNIM